MRDLARQLFALEAKQTDASRPSLDVAVRVCEKLRVPLLQFAGAAGYSSLLSRALTLASVDEPALKAVQVRADGSLTGFDRMGTSESPSLSEHPGVALVSHLLALLVTFIGESITMTLLRDGWPNESFGVANQRAEEKK